MSCLDATRHADQAAPARPAHHEPTILPRVLRSLKILDRHLDRLLIVYVRQSDPQQVLNHRESRNGNMPSPTSRPPGDGPGIAS